MGSPPDVEMLRSQIPADLQAQPTWVCWRFEVRDGQPTKVPVCSRTNRRASSTDPSSWGSFDDAILAWTKDASLDGIGFVFPPDGSFVGIDLDECISERGALSDGAREIVELIGSYTETSPSGRGVKIFIRARKPEVAKCVSTKVEGAKRVEVYSKGRFFTVTGRHLVGASLLVEERQAALDVLYARLWPPEGQQHLRSSVSHASRAGFDGDDDALVARASAARNGDKFRGLWAGDTSMHSGDESAADLALCSILAFWAGPDTDRIDRLFRRSDLYRDKWDERRGDRTYGQMTIDRAIADCAEVFSSRGPRIPPGSEMPSPSGAATDGEGDGLAIPLGQRDPATGRLVLSPRRTLPTAEAYIREFHHHADARTLHGYGGLLMEWRGNRYGQVEEESIRQRLQPWLHAGLRYVVNKQTGESELVDFESNPTTVKQALDTIRSFVHLPASTVSPSWLDDSQDRPPALEILPCRTRNLHIPTGRVLAPTPALFTINALDFDYDPEPEPPERWVKFLEQLFGDDLESVDLLQEWMGYCLTSDTSQQKMLLLVGPRRSGKGTIGRVLTRLVGAANVVGPTTSSLAGNFGLQPLIEKSLAIVSDARFGGESVGTVVERLLCISGEDTLTVDRKFLGSVSMKLATRFVFLTNELPRLTDASTALAGRFLVLRLTHSFYGSEDVTLSDQLVAELPGILHWAIEGWKRLKARGRFVQPASVEDAIRDLEDLASPVSAFVRERCEVGPGRRAWIDELYKAWQAWCEQDGRTHVTNKQAFGRDLTAAVPGIVRRRGTGMASFYEGISFTGGTP